MANEPSALVPFNPSTLAEANSMAEMLSKSALIPTALKGKPSDVMVILLHGRELGLSPMQSLAELHVIEGRPGSSAALKVGLCKAKPSVCEYFRMVESTEKQATYATRRVGDPEPTTLTYTMQDAATAGLLGKKNWKENPKAMLRARCSSQLATAVYPDLVKGLATEDELEPVEEKELNPPPPQTEALKEKVREKLKKAKAAEVSDAEVGESTPPKAEKPPELAPAEPRAKPTAIQARAAKLWRDAAALGWTLEGFQGWVKDVIGAMKPSGEWTMLDLSALEEAFARGGVEAEAQAAV